MGKIKEHLRRDVTFHDCPLHELSPISPRRSSQLPPHVNNVPNLTNETAPLSFNSHAWGSQ